MRNSSAVLTNSPRQATSYHVIYSMTPEQEARAEIDKFLTAAGWSVQPRDKSDSTAADQIRTILRTFNEELFTEIFPGRTSCPNPP